MALLTELGQNAARQGETQVAYAHVPFQRTALDAARGDYEQLPDALRVELQAVDLAVEYRFLETVLSELKQKAAGV